MSARIVLFGATGYMGVLAAHALVGRGVRPVLAARNAQRLEALAGELGGLDTAIADVGRPETVRALVARGDVLLSTVGPFERYGEPAVRASIAAGAHYLDSTGEGPFIREVFEHHGADARASGCALLTAFGYDFVPGNLAGALALREAGEAASRVDIGHFTPGRFAVSGGTRASAAGVILEPGFAWRGGRLVAERQAARVGSFRVHAANRPAVSISSSEHVTLPRLHPGLREVNVYLGTFGAAARPLQALSAVGSVLLRIPTARSATQAAVGRFIKGSTGGPDADARMRSGIYVVAVAYDSAQEESCPTYASQVSTSMTSQQACCPGAPPAPPSARCRTPVRSARPRASASTSSKGELPKRGSCASIPSRTMEGASHEKGDASPGRARVARQAPGR